MPELHVPEKDFDYLVYIEFVLDGEGVAWLTDVDIDLEPAPELEPQSEEDAEAKRSKTRPARKKLASSGASPGR